MLALLMGMRMLVFVVVRMGMRMGVRRAVRMGMCMAVDGFVVVVIKVHDASSVLFFCLYYSFSTRFCKAVGCTSVCFSKNFFGHFPILSGISM